MLLSIVVPVYNIEDYIVDCLKSLEKSIRISGEYSRIEVICIDDGSSDKSIHLINEFLAKTSYNFQCFTKTNGGLSDARNYGLTKAKGRYISFVDGDDFVSDQYINSIFKYIYNDYDLIFFDFFNYYSEKDNSLFNAIDDEKYLWTIGPSACNKVWKKEKFLNCLFPKDKIYEDVATTYKLLIKVKKWKYIKEGLYYYRKNRPGSILSTSYKKNNKNSDIFLVLEDLYNYIIKNSNTDQDIRGLEYQYIKLLLWSNLYREMKIYRFNFIGLYKSIYHSRKFIDEKFPNWTKNIILNDNSYYFYQRFGEKYNKKLGMIGKGFMITNIVLVSLIYRNYRRK